MNAIAPPRPRTPQSPSPSRGVPREGTHLGGYTTRDGREREIISTPGTEASTLVIDRDALTRAQERLIARIHRDESDANTWVMCRMYLAESEERRYCRPVTPRDRDATAQAARAPWVPGDAWTLVLESAGPRPGRLGLA